MARLKFVLSSFHFTLPQLFILLWILINCWNVHNVWWIIVDFGHAVQLTRKRPRCNSLVGSPSWLAPVHHLTMCTQSQTLFFSCFVVFFFSHVMIQRDCPIKKLNNLGLVGNYSRRKVWRQSGCVGIRTGGSSDVWWETPIRRLCPSESMWQQPSPSLSLSFISICTELQEILSCSFNCDRSFQWSNEMEFLLIFNVLEFPQKVWILWGCVSNRIRLNVQQLLFCSM
jgi:hypothetical protein